MVEEGQLMERTCEQQVGWFRPMCIEGRRLFNAKDQSSESQANSLIDDANKSHEQRTEVRYVLCFAKWR